MNLYAFSVDLALEDLLDQVDEAEIRLLEAENALLDIRSIVRAIKADRTKASR